MQINNYSYFPNSGVARLFFFTKKFVNLHEMWTYTFINSNKNLTLHVFSTLHVYKKWMIYKITQKFDLHVYFFTK